ncbi:MAG: hypothetical protein R2795_16910 [Saprospiraceae bacterium]
MRQRQLVKEYQRKEYSEEVEALIQEKNEWMSMLEQELWWNDQYDRLSVDILRSPQLPGKNEQQLIDKKYSELLAQPIPHQSFGAQRRYYQSMALLNQLKGNSEAVLHYFQASVALWNQYPKTKVDGFFNYMGDMANYLYAVSRNPQHFHKLPALLQELRNQTPPNVQAEQLLFERSIIYELVFLLNQQQTSITEPLMRIEAGLKKYDLLPSSELSILFNTILLLFLSDRFTDCLKWMKKLWQVQKQAPNLRLDIQDGSRIIFLLAVYKTAVFEDIENGLRTIQRYFAKRKESPLRPVHAAVNTAIQQLQSASSKKEELQTLAALNDQIALLAHPVSAGIDEVILLWIQSLLQSKTITELRRADS